MNTQQLYKILDLTNIIALATSVNNKPNVRIVNFCYDLNRPGILYFATDRTNPKVKEMITNPHISFTTIPLDKNTIPHAINNQSIVKKSKNTLKEIQNLFIAKIPKYEETIDAIGEYLDIFEINIKQAVIFIDFETIEYIYFG